MHVLSYAFYDLAYFKFAFQVCIPGGGTLAHLLMVGGVFKKTIIHLLLTFIINYFMPIYHNFLRFT